RSLPFNTTLDKYLNSHNQIFVVESNRDGQMKNILSICFPKYAEKLVSIAHNDGLALSAEWITREIESFLEG
ncbi:MAG: 2-oxoacid:acceptor oxidoreductase subunit alpha, partial [Pelolinea sp.]|nr:2-oxoacid:acceptor oxidoreductase subunit alpha [Pelolinea sp.]